MKGTQSLFLRSVVTILFPVCAFIAMFTLSLPGYAQKGTGTLADVPRIAIDKAREKSLSGEALLVCAYNSDERFNKMRLDGAIPLSKFKEMLPHSPRNSEIIFYCA